MIVEGICLTYERDHFDYQIVKEGIKISDNLKIYAGMVDEKYEVGKILEMKVKENGVYFKAEMSDEDKNIIENFYPCAYGRIFQHCGKHIRKFNIDGINILQRTAHKGCQFTKIS